MTYLTLKCIKSDYFHDFHDFEDKKERRKKREKRRKKRKGRKGKERKRKEYCAWKWLDNKLHLLLSAGRSPAVATVIARKMLFFL